MYLIVEITGFIMICWLLVNLFRALVEKAEQYLDLVSKINASNKIEQGILSHRKIEKLVPPSRNPLKARKEGVKVYTQRNR